MRIESKTILVSYRDGNNPAFCISLPSDRAIEPNQLLESVVKFFDNLYIEKVQAEFIEYTQTIGYSAIELRIGDSVRTLNWTFLKTIEL